VRNISRRDVCPILPADIFRDFGKNRVLGFIRDIECTWIMRDIFALLICEQYLVHEISISLSTGTSLSMNFQNAPWVDASRLLHRPLPGRSRSCLPFAAVSSSFFVLMGCRRRPEYMSAYITLMPSTSYSRVYVIALLNLLAVLRRDVDVRIL
jgi:hypothetical protein